MNVSRLLQNLPKRIVNNFKVNSYCSVKNAENLKIQETAEVLEKPKEKLIQKWISFWKLLLNDYKDVIIDTGKHMKSHPCKTSIWFSIFGGFVICCKLNPDEESFRAEVVNNSNDFIFISPSIRNNDSITHLKAIQSYFSTGQIKRISFGVFSLILLNFKNKDSALYKDNCSYIQPTYAEIVKHNVIDVGFLNKWWILERKMINCDINENEWM